MDKLAPINWQIVFSICRERLGDFQYFVRSVARFAGL